MVGEPQNLPAQGFMEQPQRVIINAAIGEVCLKINFPIPILSQPTRTVRLHLIAYDDPVGRVQGETLRCCLSPKLDFKQPLAG